MNTELFIESKSKEKLRLDLSKSDRIMLYILVAHLPFIYFLVPAGFDTHIQGAIPATLAVLASVAAYVGAKGTLISRSVIAVSLMMMSMVLIMQQMGRLEMHFHIFSGLAFLIIWRDWKVLVIAAGVIAVHHAASVPLQLSQSSFGDVPYVVYGQSCDWPTFFVHAVFVVIETGILIFFCVRLNTQFSLSNRVAATLKYVSDNKDLTVVLDNVKTSTSEDKELVESLDNFYQLIRGSLTKFQDTSENLQNISDSSIEISDSNLSQLNSQSDYIMTVASSVQEMASTIGEIATTTSGAAEASDSARTLSTESGIKVTDTVVQMSELVEQLNGAKVVVDNLAQDTNAIVSILDVIRSIADQTNLLALNAAIEAARAGEQGRGFAVVADEVRTLAQRSQNATNEVDSVIDKLQSAAGEAVKIMELGQAKSELTIESAENAKELLEKANDATNHISNLSIQIATAVEEQKSVSDGISKDMESISVSNIHVKEKLEENAQLSNSLAEISLFIYQEACQLKVK
ncbi:MAG: methyl-accepting chemotaxis protein [Kangiellaceae bacterium]